MSTNNKDTGQAEWLSFFVAVVPIIAIIHTLATDTDLSCMLSSFVPPACYVLYHTTCAATRSWKANAPARARARELARERAEESARKRAEYRASDEQRRAEKKRTQEDNARTDQSRRDVETAKAEVEAYYQTYADMLSDILPLELFRTNLRVLFADGVTAPEAWTAARDLITQMRPLVEQAKGKKRIEDQRRKQRLEQARKMNTEISGLKQRLQQMDQGPIDDDGFKDLEKSRLERQLRELEAQMELLLAGDDA